LSHYDPNWQANLNSRYILDLIERVGWTFLQAFGAELVASGWFTVDGVTDLSVLQKAGIAGIAAVLSVIKGLVAKGVGSPNTAALLPAAAETPDP
jgi:hypothetical protein